MAPRKPPLGVWLYGMRIAEIAPKGRSYDTRGNVTAIGVETYGYDGADRHLSTSNGTTTSTFVRDLTGAVVEYRLNGVIQNRYSGSVTLDAAGTNVVERTIGLTGGVVLTTRVSGDVWSYPNIAGSVTATANAAGTRTAGPLLYDPFGNPLSGYPDNQAGLLDGAWYGTADRQTQHQPGLHPAVDMGARQYQPQLGRFTETDPVEGGCANDYVYTGGDPVNSADLDGRSACPGGWSHLRDAWRNTGWHAIYGDAGAYQRRLPANGIANLFGAFRLQVRAWYGFPYRLSVNVASRGAKSGFNNVWNGVFNGGFGQTLTINRKTFAISAPRNQSLLIRYSMSLEYLDLPYDLNSTLPSGFLLRAQRRSSLCHWQGVGPSLGDQWFDYVKW